MKKTIIFAMTHLSVIVNGIEIPNNVVWAIGQVEGGTTGKATKEPNGSYSYGRYQIRTVFLADVNKYYGWNCEIKDVRDYDNFGAEICRYGLAMIMERRKCKLRTAVATYNGGWGNRNAEQCRDYAKRVMAIANKEVNRKL